MTHQRILECEEQYCIEIESLSHQAHPWDIQRTCDFWKSSPLAAAASCRGQTYRCGR